MSSDRNTAPDAGNTAVRKERGNQPSLLNIKSIPTNSLMNVESDVLEPLTFSQSEAIWELPAKGFLHPGSSIEVGFSLGSTAANRVFPFLGVGVHSLVRRAVLRTTAGRVINDTDDYNSLASAKSLFKNNSSNKEREQYTSGRQIDFQVQYAVGNDVATTDFTTVAAGTGGYGICNNLEYNELVPATPADEGSQGQNVQTHLLNKMESTFQLKIAELFPYFEMGNQLPLFLLPNEKIQIVLYWANSTGTQRFAISNGDAADEVINMERTKCKFIADYTFYDGELMDRFREEYKNGMTFQYNDTRLSKQTVTVGQALSNTRNLGGNGMFVDNVMWNYNTPTATGELKLLGEYNAAAPTALGVSRNKLTSNLFINSEFLFPQSVSNPARHFHNLKEASGAVPFISRQCYSGQGVEGIVSGADVHAFEGRDQTAELAGNFFQQGFRTSGLGRRIDNNGIRLHSDAIMAASSTQRAWLSIRRYVVISDGHLESYFV